MIYILRRIKRIAYFLAMLILFQSCVIYNKKPSAIEEATSKENTFIKIITKEGNKYKFRWVEEKDGNVYSITNTKRILIKKSKLGKSNFKHKLINIENQGDYIRGLKMTSKDTTTVLLPIEQIEAIKLPNKGLSALVPFASLALVMGLFVGGMLWLLSSD